MANAKSEKGLLRCGAGVYFVGRMTMEAVNFRVGPVCCWPGFGSARGRSNVA